MMAQNGLPKFIERGVRRCSMRIIPFEFPDTWDYLNLIPINDLHIGDPRVQLPLFRRFIKAVAEDERAFVLLNGDNLNNAIKTSISNVYNEQMPPNEQRKFLAGELLPIKDKILIAVDGNHEYRTKKEVDLSAVEWLCDQLKIENQYIQTKDKTTPLYFEDEAFVKISLGKGKDGKRVTYGIYLTHGAGGGGRLGSSVNKAEDTVLLIEGADCICVGHVHKKGASAPGYRRMDLRNNKVTEHSKLVVVSSHWSNYGGYAARKMLRPSAKGSVPIRLDGREKKLLATVEAS